MRLFLVSPVTPPPPSAVVVDVADDRLSAGLNGNMFDPYGLLALTAEPSQRLNLSGERALELHRKVAVQL